RVLTNEVNRVIELQQSPEAAPDQAALFAQRASAPRSQHVALEPRAAPSNALELRKLLASLWGPIETTGIVLLVLVFVLLEHESLRDRFIRLAGATDIRATTLALNDAGARLSRFFVSQFAVNLAFAAAVWLSLSLLHLPQAMLLGALAGVLRFVPYVGVGIAALLSSALAFAVDPGWSLAAMTLGAFILLDVVAGQLLEPHLYGHATGLSPLAVVVGTIFWSALWGPAGLILSTPLTLCLVVAGRHMKSLGALEMLLSNGRALTLPQRFYQRALSGDPHEIIADARAFLKKDSLAAYCDRVLIPALHLAQLDADKGAASNEQQARIRRVIVDVVAALSSSLKLPRVHHRGSVLDNADPGRWLRQQREHVSGRWQGPIGVPPGSVVICAGLGSPADDLAAELLVRLLRMQKVDARHFSSADVDAGLPPGADPDGVSIVYLVSAFPGPQRAGAGLLGERIRRLLPCASLVNVSCPGVTAPAADHNSGGGGADKAQSLVQAIQICTLWRQAHQRRQDPAEPGPRAARRIWI
ncbi:MAG TPA: AI-2E family transporter, partial [Burkholderiaceae bacterium]|nr:AI-2E family transporter [Burkholderiaceae bacterium]